MHQEHHIQDEKGKSSLGCGAACRSFLSALWELPHDKLTWSSTGGLLTASNELRDLLLNRIHWNVVLPGSDCVARVCGQGLIVLLQYYFCAIGLQYCLPVLRRVKFGEPVLLLSANLNEPQ